VAEAPGRRGALSQRDLDPDPIAQFRVWLEQAAAAGIKHPEAMALATANGWGQAEMERFFLTPVAGELRR